MKVLDWARGLTGRRRGHRPVTEPVQGAERDARWYDEMLEKAPQFLEHYTASHYYFFWTVVVDRLRRAGVRSLLDVGCGTGQVAALLRDTGFEQYVGLDFSPRRVEAARRACPSFRFVVADAFETDLFETVDYDAVVSLEFLEHVERDLDVLRRVRAGTRVVASVPNFPWPSHVRYFRDAGEVYDRYRGEFHDLTVDAFVRDTRETTYFLMEGIKR